MNVGKITSNQINPTPVTTTTTSTSNSKNIQNQITTKQQLLSSLTSDSKLDAQEKEKKRREIQKEIDELNRKLELARLKQEEADKKRAKEQQKNDAQKAHILAETNTNSTETAKVSSEKTGSAADKTSDEKQTDTAKSNEIAEDKQQHIDMAIEDVQKMLTADYELQKELAQKHVDSQIESTIQVIKSEIRQDRFYETDTSQKEAELETIQAKENFWTEEAQKKLSEKQQATQTESNAMTGMNVQAKVTIDMI